MIVSPRAGERAESPSSLADRYDSVRAFTEALAEPLGPEDQLVQSMPDASPTKWHRAHTTWFFETFVLAHAPSSARSPSLAPFKPFDPGYAFLFNSYYEAVGPRHARAARGVLSRPSVAEVGVYRSAVDERMRDLLARPIGDDARGRSLRDAVILGLHHEQQHQELLLTDIQHAFAQNPLRPVYRAAPAQDVRETFAAAGAAAPVRWIAHAAGTRRIGRDASTCGTFETFAFDNESPAHRVFAEPFELASRAVTCGEYLAFVEDGGYRRPELWLSDGWAAVQAAGWGAPLYWDSDADCRGGWRRFTLSGPREIEPNEPVCHVSYYEADAFARWAGARLPTEAEWEIAAIEARARGELCDGAFVDDGALSPRPCPASSSEGALHGLFGDVWEWTSSAYAPYPGFEPAPGALGEYNGKFMCSQMVLRGGSCFTPRSHVRATYRNFFPPSARWQMAGIRLARSR